MGWHERITHAAKKKLKKTATIVLTSDDVGNWATDSRSSNLRSHLEDGRGETAPEAHFVSAEEARTAREVPTVSRGTREERIRPGTPSRAPDLLVDYVGGRFVPASVRRRSSVGSRGGLL